eukprot:4838581-Amphidinium_carterae.1
MAHMSHSRRASSALALHAVALKQALWQCVLLSSSASTDTGSEGICMKVKATCCDVSKPQQHYHCHAKLSGDILEEQGDLHMSQQSLHPKRFAPVRSRPPSQKIHIMSHHNCHSH